MYVVLDITNATLNDRSQIVTVSIANKVRKHCIK